MHLPVFGPLEGVGVDSMVTGVLSVGEDSDSLGETSVGVPDGLEGESPPGVEGVPAGRVGTAGYVCE